MTKSGRYLGHAFFSLVGESPKISNLQTESNYLDSFKFYCILVIWPPSSGGWGRWVGGYLGAWGAPTIMHAHGYTNAHTHVKHANKHDTHEGGHLQFLYKYILA